MKKETLMDAINNIDPEIIEKSVNYRPNVLRRNVTRIAALVACIAVIITSVPLALILNKEEPAEHKHGEADINDQIIIEDDIKGFGCLQLSNGTLDLNVIQLASGKINKDTDATIYDKYVFEYTPVDGAAIFDEMINKAYPYYGLTEFEYEKRPSDAYVHGAYIENSRYSLQSYDDIIEKRIYSAATTLSAEAFINKQLKNNGYEPGNLKFPEEDTGEKIFEAFADHLGIINDFLVEDIDSCLVYPVISGKCTVYYWNSSNERLNQEAEEIRELTKDDKYEITYIGVSTTFRARSIEVEYTMNEDGYVEKIDVKYLKLPNRIDYEKYEEEILDYLALAIPNKYFCDATEESFLECALGLETFLKDVFSIEGFENEYEFEIRDSDKTSSFGVTKVGTLKILITPTPDHANDVVEFTFYSIDGETFYLYDIVSKTSIGGDKYIELITPERAIDNLVRGYAIGDAGQGCYICREKYRPEILEYVQNNMTFELVTLPGIVFETQEDKIPYDLPFYRFTTVPDESGRSYVAYVIAINYGYNIRFDLKELYRTIYEYNLSTCPNAADHKKIEREKTKRTDELKEAYINSFPEEEKKKASYEAYLLFQW